MGEASMDLNGQEIELFFWVWIGMISKYSANSFQQQRGPMLRGTIFGKPNNQDEPVDDEDSFDGNDANLTAKLDEQVDNEREQWDEELFGVLSG